MTIEELIQQTLCKGGVQQATGVKISYADGTSVTIHSDDHPVLKQTVNEAQRPTVTPVQSAQGG